MQSVSQRAFEANNRGERLVGEGKLDEALTAFNEAVLASPGYATAWLNHAHVLERLGRISEAQAEREAARSLTAAMESRSFQSTAQAPSSQWTAPTAQRTRYEYGSEDVVGPGRYILNFFLAGLVGLVVTFVLRNHGWLATWISLAIFVVGLIILVAAGPEALGLDFENSSR
jgi:tetratricopeptide (TPR) repeat protein